MTNPTKRNSKDRSRRDPKRTISDRPGKNSNIPARRGKIAGKRPATSTKRPFGTAKRTTRPVTSKRPRVISEPEAVVTQKVKTPATPLPGIRLNKYLADQGVASRREADVLIATGQVTINGKKAGIGDRVDDNDVVELIGNTKDKRYLAYYKGRGIITHSPSEKEVDIATRLRKDYGITDLAPVGRLDKDSEGLIILSNDGRITGPLLDPELDHEKEYSVTVDKKVTPAFTKLMELGVMIEGYKTKPAVVVASPKNENRFNITLTEGKKHQIRRMCAALGYQIESLKRVRVMNIEVGALKPNQYRKINGDELKQFLTLLGVTS